MALRYSVAMPHRLIKYSIAATDDFVGLESSSPTTHELGAAGSRQNALVSPPRPGDLCPGAVTERSWEQATAHLHKGIYTVTPSSL